MLDLKAKVLQLEKEKKDLQIEKKELQLRSIIVSPSQGKVMSIKELIRAMSQINLKDDERKELKEENQKLK